MPETIPDWSSARDAILGEKGAPLLRFMRDLFFNRRNSVIDRQLVALAQRLGWIAPDYIGDWKLTPHGARVADSAREYCNWLDDGRQLPAAIVETELLGKAVLDVGCGFGRHVFTASRSAALAVGLEAEPAYLQMSSILRSREGLDSAVFVCGSGETIPFKDHTFDVILCTRSLHYMDAFAVIPEMARVLRVGGRIYLIVATFQDFISEFLGQPQHIPGIRERLRVVKQAIMSICVSLTGKWVRWKKPEGTTASYVLLTVRQHLRVMENAGLKVVTRSPSEQLFVVERTR